MNVATNLQLNKNFRIVYLIHEFGVNVKRGVDRSTFTVG